MSVYLDLLDAMLGQGAARFGAGFRERQAAFVRARQGADGGFSGRLGGSDPYYTDFALRALSLLGADDAPFRRAGEYWGAAAPAPGDVVSAFNRLNAARVLGGCGIRVALDRTGLTRLLERSMLPDGGLTRPGDDRSSAYHTFLGALCLQMLGREMPQPALTAREIAALQSPDGGFRDLPGEGAGQTNATAAAVAVLTLCGALAEETARKAADFLARVQGPDGGLRAHAGAPDGDLLSTFTGLLTLSALGPLANRVDLAGIARFVRALAAPGGGFAGAAGDAEADVEYTYYGVATLALLSAAVALDRAEGG